MSAAYALPGEVIEVRQSLAALRAYELRAGEMDPLPVEIEPGYYALVCQRAERLFIAAVGEGGDGQVGIVGPLFVVNVAVLGTEAVGVTYLVAREWEIR